jgi:hypothetical protein
MESRRFHGVSGIRQPIGSGADWSPVTGHRQGTADERDPTCGSSQERLSLCRVPAERGGAAASSLRYLRRHLIMRQTHSFGRSRGSVGMWNGLEPPEPGSRRIRLGNPQERRIRTILKGPLKRKRRAVTLQHSRQPKAEISPDSEARRISARREYFCT